MEWVRAQLGVSERRTCRVLKRGRLWLNEGSCVRLRPASPNHVWAYDFVHERTHDGQALRLLTVVDEYTRECLAIRVARRLSSEDVLQHLTELFVARGKPAYLRSDNGPEPTASAVREWLARVGVTTLFIEPGSPWEKAKVENAVLQVERWVLAPLRHQRFFSVPEANQAIRARLDWLNDRPLTRLAGTRRSLWRDLDPPALRPLSPRRFDMPTWKTDVGVECQRLTLCVARRDSSGWVRVAAQSR